MGIRGKLLTIAAVAATVLAAVAPVALGASPSHTFSVTLTIESDSAGHRLAGAVVSQAPSEYCDTARIRIRRAMPGHDEVVAKVRPRKGGEWSLKLPAGLSGDRVYAETSRYQLPSRPVVCLGARSAEVTAP
jgi:hypothetical protein